MAAGLSARTGAEPTGADVEGLSFGTGGPTKTALPKLSAGTDVGELASGRAVEPAVEPRLPVSTGIVIPPTATEPAADPELSARTDRAVPSRSAEPVVEPGLSAETGAVDLAPPGAAESGLSPGTGAGRANAGVGGRPALFVGMRDIAGPGGPFKRGRRPVAPRIDGGAKIPEATGATGTRPVVTGAGSQTNPAPRTGEGSLAGVTAGAAASAGRSPGPGAPTGRTLAGAATSAGLSPGTGALTGRVLPDAAVSAVPSPGTAPLAGRALADVAFSAGLSPGTGSPVPAPRRHTVPSATGRGRSGSGARVWVPQLGQRSGGVGPSLSEYAHLRQRSMIRRAGEDITARRFAVLRRRRQRVGSRR